MGSRVIEDLFLALRIIIDIVPKDLRVIDYEVQESGISKNRPVGFRELFFIPEVCEKVLVCFRQNKDILPTAVVRGKLCGWTE